MIGALCTCTHACTMKAQKGRSTRDMGERQRWDWIHDTNFFPCRGVWTCFWGWWSCSCASTLLSLHTWQEVSGGSLGWKKMWRGPLLRWPPRPLIPYASYSVSYWDGMCYLLSFQKWDWFLSNSPGLEANNHLTCNQSPGSCMNAFIRTHDGHVKQSVHVASIKLAEPTQGGIR